VAEASRRSGELEALVADLLARDALTGATLSKPRRSDPARYSKATIAPVEIAGGLGYHWRYHFGDRTTDEHLGADETERRLVHLLGGEFRQGLLHATDADHQVLAGGRGPKLLRRPPTRPNAAHRHDRVKRRVLPEGTPVPFLVELGVMSRDGTVVPRRYAKYRQVNRFLELVEDVLPDLPEGRLQVVDFGSGKSYLTFALHHLLTAVHGREVELVGLDLKDDVVATCERLARHLGAEGLRFEVGDIAGYRGLDGADLVVSLHACDTATDAALERAVRWHASVVLAVPCCQHELLGQIQNPELAPLLRHGILKERFAAEVTDAARAQLLTLVGYETQLVEFVPLEHTPKNVLIRAVRRPQRRRDRAAREYRALADALGIQPWLERALADVLPE
jgi:hypothetical protein